jgi:hypothetical protein
LPTAELSRLSQRSYFDLPRSIAEIPSYLMRDHPPPAHANGTPSRWFDVLIGKPPVILPHAISKYDYSLPPWRLAEFLWPNFSGRTLPEHCRWLEELSGLEGSWTPSQYMGLLPLILALSAFSLRGAETRTVWLSWMVVIAILASFGSYGLGWVWRHLTGTAPVLDPTGGLYWLLTVVLPGFVEFRYPSKLLIVAALGLSGLAATGWERLAAGEIDRPRKLLFVACLASVLGLFLWAAAAAPWNDRFAHDFHRYNGPLNVKAAYWQLGTALAYTMLSSLGLYLVLRWKWKASRNAVGDTDDAQRVITSNLALAAIVFTAIDLALANRWMVAVAPTRNWQRESRLATLLAEAERQRGGESETADRPLRVFRFDEGEPRAWPTTSSAARIEDIVQWERDTLAQKYGAWYGISPIRPSGSVLMEDFTFFWAPAVTSELVEFVHKRRAMDALGVRYFILSRHSTPTEPGRSSEGLRNRWLEPAWSIERPQSAPEGAPLDSAVEDSKRLLQSLDEEIEVLYNSSHFQPAWIVRGLHVTPPIEIHDRERLLPILQAMLFPLDNWLNLREAAWVEHQELAQKYPQGWLQLQGESNRMESCRVVAFQPQRVEIEATLTSPGLVVLADLYYPGWILDVESSGRSQSVPVLRTNRVMRGVLLPAGEHKLIFRYRPWSFYLGAVITTSTLILALCFLAWAMWKWRKAALSRPATAEIAPA